jgi:hypothetical protein
MSISLTNNLDNFRIRQDASWKMRLSKIYTTALPTFKMHLHTDSCSTEHVSNLARIMCIESGFTSMLNVVKNRALLTTAEKSPTDTLIQTCEQHTLVSVIKAKT